MCTNTPSDSLSLATQAFATQLLHVAGGATGTSKAIRHLKHLQIFLETGPKRRVQRHNTAGSLTNLYEQG